MTTRNAIDALLGRLLQDGEELELRGGLNFTSPLTLTESDAGYDVSLVDSVLGSITYLREQDVSGAYTSSTEFINCRITGAITVTGTATFRGCRAAGAYAISATTIEVDRASAYALLTAGCTVNVLPTNIDGKDLRYGSGSSGDTTISVGTTPSNANEYANVTFTAGGSWRDNGGRAPLYVSGLLDLSAASAGAIAPDAAGVGNGSNGAGAAGGASNGASNGAAQQWGGRLGGATGSTGTTGAGATPAAPTAFRNGLGGTGGASAAGGTASGGGTAGGAGGASAGTGQAAVHGAHVYVASPGATQTAPETSWAGFSGRGGASGGGDGANAGGGGGGSGTGGGYVVGAFRGIKFGVSTATGALRAVGGNGGNGGNGVGGNAGGGAGGGGGGGGFILVYYEWIIGTPSNVNVCQATGGTAGTGGNGVGTGVGANGSDGGSGGQIVLINTITGRRTVVVGSAGSAGSARSGTTGGAGGAGGACNADFPAAPGG
jgi:hypothetical protein